MLTQLGLTLYVALFLGLALLAFSQGSGISQHSLRRRLKRLRLQMLKSVHADRPLKK